MDVADITSYYQQSLCIDSTIMQDSVNNPQVFRLFAGSSEQLRTVQAGTENYSRSQPVSRTVRAGTGGRAGQDQTKPGAETGGRGSGRNPGGPNRGRDSDLCLAVYSEYLHVPPL